MLKVGCENAEKAKKVTEIGVEATIGGMYHRRKCER